MAAPTVRSAAGVAQGTNGGTDVVTKPSGLTVGDYMLGFQMNDADGALANMTAPSGFASLASQAGNASSNFPYLKLWVKVADSTDTAATNFTFNNTSGSNSAAGIIAITVGTFDTTTPTTTPVFTTQARTSNQTITAPTINPGVDQGLLITVMSADCNNITQSFPSPPTGETTEINVGQNYALLGVFVQALSGTGATGTRSATPTPSATTNGWTSASFIVNPAPAPAYQPHNSGIYLPILAQ